MVAEQIEAKLEEILNPETVLDRRKRVIHIFDEFKDEDAAFREELTSSNISKIRLEEIAILISSRFGKVVKSPTQTGSTHTYYTLVKPENSNYTLRLKGFNNLLSIEQNIQHLEFLRLKKESGYGAGIGYGPDLIKPLYIVMLQGDTFTTADFKTSKDTLDDTDPQPRTLNNILDFLGSYSLNQDHHGPSENINSHIDLVGAKMLDELLTSQSLEQQGQTNYWVDLVNTAISDMKTHIRGDEISTWVASDPIIENFIKITNGNPKETIMFIDQGYFPLQINTWKNKLGINNYEDMVRRAFSGRIEYNIGQMYYSLAKMDNIDKSIIDIFNNRMSTLAIEGRYNGSDVRQGRLMPGPDNIDLSSAYINLGTLVPVITDIARKGETLATKACAKALIRRVADGHPFGLPKKLFTEIRGKSFNP
ncbi:MAG: hypothetical protein AABW84_02605 [Nanoarchaeota archaeon]